MIKDFDRLLRLRLSAGLPGESAQSRMSAYRKFSTAEFLQRNPDHRKSAVMILLWLEKAGRLRSLLIRRPEYEGHHSGQMALPGGQFEAGDVDLETTARRETAEEIGYLVYEEEVAGKLSPLYIPVSNFLVQPFLAVLSARPHWAPDPEEVGAIVEYDVSDLLRPEIRKSRERLFANGQKAKTPYFEIEGSEVWGATAMILSEFSEIVAPLISS